MRRPLACLTAVAIVAILLAVGWLIWGETLRTYLVLRSCERAWNRVEDYQADVELRVEAGVLLVPVKGRLWFKKPDSYRLDLGTDSPFTECRVYGGERQVWAYAPGWRLAANISLARDGMARSVLDQSPRQWVEQLTEGVEARLLGDGEIDGRDCHIVELRPTQGTGAPEPGGGDGTPMPATGQVHPPGVWSRARIWVDKATRLPVKATGFDREDRPVVTWTARNVQLDQGLSDSEFRFEPPPNVSVIHREFDPEHPESLFLPPREQGRGSSWEDVFGALEDEIEEQFGDLFEPGKSDEPSSEPSLDSFLQGLEERLSGDAPESPPGDPEPAPAERETR